MGVPSGALSLKERTWMIFGLRGSTMNCLMVGFVVQSFLYLLFFFSIQRWVLFLCTNLERKWRNKHRV
uniref:Uncharacterized protein n=1 Tax=Siphoviridae sp. ctX926 TaxID=2826366 RepID=A0A8S5M1K7_9CAUD|nr:MAG TPA: hypothetical protein [Siphoviridae sp. ctX926]